MLAGGHFRAVVHLKALAPLFVYRYCKASPLLAPLSGLCTSSFPCFFCSLSLPLLSFASYHLFHFLSFKRPAPSLKDPVLLPCNQTKTWLQSINLCQFKIKISKHSMLTTADGKPRWSSVGINWKWRSSGSSLLGLSELGLFLYHTFSLAVSAFLLISSKLFPHFKNTGIHI